MLDVIGLPRISFKGSSSATVLHFINTSYTSLSQAHPPPISLSASEHRFWVVVHVYIVKPSELTPWGGGFVYRYLASLH